MLLINPCGNIRQSVLCHFAMVRNLIIYHLSCISIVNKYANPVIFAELSECLKLLLAGGHDKRLRFEENSFKINATQVVQVLMGHKDHCFRNGN